MSKWNDSYFSITINASGHKFYGLDPAPVNPAVNISIESDLTVSGTRIQLAESSISIDSSLSTSAIKIQYAQADLTSTAVTVVVSLEQALAKISIDIESSLTVTAEEILFAQSTISVESNISITAYKISYASVPLLSGSLTTSVTAIKIIYASSSVSGLLVNAVVGKEILYAKINIAAQAIVKITNAIRFSNNIVEDTQSIRTLLLLDDKPLSEHNRTLSSSIINPFIENGNWKNSRSRYYKRSSGRMTFSISWKDLPNAKYDTVDSKFGRDFIETIGKDPDLHVLKVLNIDSNGTTPYTEEEYNVIVKNYSEKLTRRDIDHDIYLWDCDLELEEV